MDYENIPEIGLCNSIAFVSFNINKYSKSDFNVAKNATVDMLSIQTFLKNFHVGAFIFQGI